MSFAKMAEPTETPFGWVNSVGTRNIVLDGVQIPPPWEGAHLRVHVPANCNIFMHKCILHCLPAVPGKCACLAHAAMTAFAALRGDKTAMWPNYFGPLLLSLSTDSDS